MDANLSFSPIYNITNLHQIYAIFYIQAIHSNIEINKPNAKVKIEKNRALTLPLLCCYTDLHATIAAQTVVARILFVIPNTFLFRTP